MNIDIGNFPFLQDGSSSIFCGGVLVLFSRATDESFDFCEKKPEDAFIAVLRSRFFSIFSRHYVFDEESSLLMRSGRVESSSLRSVRESSSA